MVIVNRQMLSLMIPTEIRRVSSDEARVIIWCENWHQPVTLRKSQTTSAKEWSQAVKVDNEPVMRAVTLGSVQSGDEVVIMDGGSRIYVHGIRLSTSLYLTADD